MNARGERVFSPEGGWVSLGSSAHPAIDPKTVSAAGNGEACQSLRGSIALRALLARETGLQAALAGEDRGLPRGGGRAMIRKDLDGLERAEGAERPLNRLKHHVADVRSAHTGIDHRSPGVPPAVVSINDESPTNELAGPSRVNAKPSEQCARKAVVRCLLRHLDRACPSPKLALGSLIRSAGCRTVRSPVTSSSPVTATLLPSSIRRRQRDKRLGAMPLQRACIAIGPSLHGHA